MKAADPPEAFGAVIGKAPGALDTGPENLKGRVAPGNCSPGAPTDPYVPSQAYGSSRHEFATGRHTEWIAIGGGSGYRSSIRVN